MKPLSSVILLLTASMAQALVIPGPNGTGTGNTTQASLNTYLSGFGVPAFPYWGNVISVSDSSGVFLGSSGSYGWVMTAAHVNTLGVGSGVINVGGTPYFVRDSITIGANDVRLYRIGGEMGDPALPALSNIPLDSTQLSGGTSLLMFGRGGRAEGTLNSAASSDAQLGLDPARFEWAAPQSQPMRWGTNASAVFPPTGNLYDVQNSGPYVTNMFYSSFSDPGSGNYLNATEASVAVSDSGGPLFTLDGGAWVLSGWNISLATFSGQPGGTTQFGNFTTYGDVTSIRANLISIMVPEPSVSGLLGLAALRLARRRRH